ncbi:AzlC family ABC transporter permease [Streptomyces sp. SBT349]|uniref:AzlC family ABC transporter permease n=1 Tax=Streptomyces sp. SBT349 TaxID=1580539 RepID=UPI00066A3AC7|nr:AzlC family ABC transporter permease [Streptomyces sp. SBT349]
MRSFCRTLDRGVLRDIALVCLADAVVGASFGAIAVSGGLPLWVPVVMSLLVFAGAAQFAAIGVVLSGGGAVAAVAAALVLNARLLPFGFAVADVFDGRGRERLLGAHLMTDESVAFALRRREARSRRAAYWVSGLGIFVSWNAAVVLGALAGGGIEDTGALGLDAAFPVVLLALVLPALADRATRHAALLGAAAAVAVTPFLPAGLPAICALAGLVTLIRRAGGAGPGPTGSGPDSRPAPAGSPATGPARDPLPGAP